MGHSDGYEECEWCSGDGIKSDEFQVGYNSDELDQKYYLLYEDFIKDLEKYLNDVFDSYEEVKIHKTGRKYNL